MLTNRSARAGDALVLTKPIGLGVISTALKRDAAPPELVAEAIRVMTTLNAGARDAALALESGVVHAATDVTGFGLLGHLRELLVGSGLAADLDVSAVPVIDGVRALLGAGMVAGGTQRNHAFVDDTVDVERTRRSTTNCCSPTPRRRAVCSSRSIPTRSTTWSTSSTRAARSPRPSIGHTTRR